MKTRTNLTISAIGVLIFALSAPTPVQAQTKIITNKQVTRAAKAEGARIPKLRTKALKPQALNQGQNDQGLNRADTHFTDSRMSSITRAGSIGNVTGTAGSDVNGQVGTTNQGNMVHGPTGGIFTSHFGSNGKKSKAAKPAVNPRTKNAKSSAPPTG